MATTAYNHDHPGGTIARPLLLANPTLRTARYDATHILRPSAATLEAERKRRENRARCAQRCREW